MSIKIYDALNDIEREATQADLDLLQKQLRELATFQILVKQNPDNNFIVKYSSKSLWTIEFPYKSITEHGLTFAEAAKEISKRVG